MHEWERVNKGYYAEETKLVHARLDLVQGCCPGDKHLYWNKSWCASVLLFEIVLDNKHPVQRAALSADFFEYNLIRID